MRIPTYFSTKIVAYTQLQDHTLTEQNYLPFLDLPSSNNMKESTDNSTKNRDNHE